MATDILKKPKGIFGYKELPAKKLDEEMAKISHLTGLERTLAIKEITDRIQTREYKQSNLIVQGSHLILTHLIGQVVSPNIPEITPNNFKITKMQFGEDNTAPAPTQDTLISPVEKTPLVYNYTVETPEYQNGASPGDLDAIITFSTLMAGTDGNGVNYQEAGLFCEAEYMFARTVFPIITKTEEIAFRFDWTIIFP